VKNCHNLGGLQMKLTNKESASLEEIAEDGRKIDTDKVANEILDWLIVNVEQFIDNQVKTFKIDLIIDGESNPPMPETRKLNDLYRHIPDDNNLVNAKDIFRADGTINMKKMNTKSANQAAKIRGCLNEITQECFNKIQTNCEKLKKLYERMIFYYEMIGFHKGTPLLREISGAVNIIKFEYEAFSMDVQVKSPTYQIQRENGEVDTIESEAKEYTIPEGFTVWVEIAFAPKVVSTSLF
jgi:hypothetical protein